MLKYKSAREDRQPDCSHYLSARTKSRLHFSVFSLSLNPLVFAMCEHIRWCLSTFVFCTIYFSLVTHLRAQSVNTFRSALNFACTFLVNFAQHLLFYLFISMHYYLIVFIYYKYGLYFLCLVAADLEYLDFSQKLRPLKKPETWKHLVAMYELCTQLTSYFTTYL